MVPIPGTQRKEELVLNDVVNVEIDATKRATGTDDWRLGYSSQGLTIHNPQKVCIIDDYLQWSNLSVVRGVYAVARAGF